MFTDSSDVQLQYRQNRSQSCPELIFGSEKPLPCRKRALSENYFNASKYVEPERPFQLQSRHSETNLMRIDKEKTFNQNNILDNSGEILAQVVFALNDFNANKEEEVPASPSGGVDLFSDHSILEDEWSIITKTSDQKPSNKFRTRAKSLYPVSKVSNEDPNTPQLTWSGNNNEIQNYISAQVRNGRKSVHKDAKFNISYSDKPKKVDSNVDRRKSVFTVFNGIFKRRNTNSANVEAAVEELEKPSTPSIAVERKSSIKMDTSRKTQFIGEPKRRQSILSNQSASSEHVLENTTIGRYTFLFI